MGPKLSAGRAALSKSRQGRAARLRLPGHRHRPHVPPRLQARPAGRRAAPEVVRGQRRADGEVCEVRGGVCGVAGRQAGVRVRGRKTPTYQYQYPLAGTAATPPRGPRLTAASSRPRLPFAPVVLRGTARAPARAARASSLATRGEKPAARRSNEERFVFGMGLCSAILGLVHSKDNCSRKRQVADIVLTLLSINDRQTMC